MSPPYHRQTVRMLHLGISAPSNLTDEVLEALVDDPAVSSLTVVRGACIRPVGDLITADVAREGGNEVIDRLRDLGAHHEGRPRDMGQHAPIAVEPLWYGLGRLGHPGLPAGGLVTHVRAPGTPADPAAAQVTPPSRRLDPQAPRRSLGSRCRRAESRSREQGH